MNDIFVNLKRFDVPRKMGGICPEEQPVKWIENVIENSVKEGLGQLKDLKVTYLLPEALLIPAINKLNEYPETKITGIEIGSQSVFREDVTEDGNFGAFTTNLPAAAVSNLGCTWSIIGHSEERADKLGLLQEYEPKIEDDSNLRKKASETVHKIINQEVNRALSQNINVLLCVGETEAERGEGSFEEQKPRIKEVLKEQLLLGLAGVEQYLPQRKIIIGYEPIWAIGPGKTPPGEEYISFVSAYIKEVIKEEFNFEAGVVYGGGLKEENARMIAGIDTIDGGLVALTKFTGDIAFEPEGLRKIIEKYLD